MPQRPEKKGSTELDEEELSAAAAQEKFALLHEKKKNKPPSERLEEEPGEDEGEREEEEVAQREKLIPKPPDEPPRRRISPRKGRKNREHYYQGKHITLENYKKLVDKLIPESHKLVTPEELLNELNINKNDEIPEIYQDILDNNIDNYDTAYIKLIENIRIFLENKKELDEI